MPITRHRSFEDERSERQRTDKDSRNPTTRKSPTDASVDLQRVIWILTATPQTVIHNQESLIDPTRIRMFLNRYGPARIKGQIKIDKRRQNTKDVQEHTCPVEAIGQTMLNVSQNQSHFECPIVQELTNPVVVDVALLNHVVSQDKGWTDKPIPTHVDFD
ncbi:hypothetical protein BY996DRAFT_6612857 [Phakopsora pachyrhizi]|nr:hypothetical protein BY996DRAFT_6612857 [Phakopsora pachyrhizi]